MAANTNFLTSLLVNRQVPEYVREDYPTFINFVEAYYEFLEQKQGPDGTNDLINKSKSLKTVSDVDASINDFQKSFYNTYASLVPLEVQADKALLFKRKPSHFFFSFEEIYFSYSSFIHESRIYLYWFSNKFIKPLNC